MVDLKKAKKECTLLHLKFIIIIFLAMFNGTISVTIYSLLYKNDIIYKYYFVIPFFLLIFLKFIRKITKRKHFENIELIIIMLISSIFLSITIKIPLINNFYTKFECNIIELLFLVLLILIYLYNKNVNNGTNFKENSKKDLFNLFYINTSKVHEIAMLLDNKIMKTVEMEQSSEEILKYDTGLNLSKNTVRGISYNQLIENSNKKSVFESFDVKTTKSIMLRKIYNVAKNSSNDIKLELGKIVMFTNINLKQQNTDNTVMLLNILKDSKINNFSNNDQIELNISKMLEELLDDFTIDYTFEDNNKTFVIRIPFKYKNYFENSYSHNDLQLGKLSIIGIYRGKINFSNVDSISSKFLEVFSQAYKNEIDKETTMELLNSNFNKPNIHDPLSNFKINYKKLNGEYHLIDLIAIIQEISFEESGSNE